MSPLYRIGVDVGGTNTDAAILDMRATHQPGRGVMASFKTPTTPDITRGIETAIQGILERSGINKSFVISVTIGTTHFINALLEADSRRLDRVAIFRLCGPFTQQVPPFSDFPIGLKIVLDGGVWYLDGGLEMDGREIRPLDLEQIRRAVREVVQSGVKTIALVGIFSPLDHRGIHEKKCKRIIQEEAPELHVACSHDIGPTGFLERENATILNAAILRTGHRVTNSFLNAMIRLRLACPLFLSQNDGTIIDARTAADYPIKTFASGITNSMTGAAFLAGIDSKHPLTPEGKEHDAREPEEPQVLVVDIGGTSTDVCSLLPSGFPRQAPGFMEIGGVRTVFSMPEVASIGLGGGSKVLIDPDGKVHVGPSSVGHSLHEQALVFGGQTLTATDVIVALGKADIGDASLVNHIPGSVIDGALKEVKRMLEELVDRIRVSTAPVYVILVGGGAILIDEDLKGVEKCIKPMHLGAANAVGAAISKVSGDVDMVEVLDGKTEKDTLNVACKRAIGLAIEKGAAPEDVRIVEVNKMLLQYMTRVTIRVQIRAVGKLLVPDDLPPDPFSPDAVEDDGDYREEQEQAVETPKIDILNAHHPTIKPCRDVDLIAYRPEVLNRVWYISDIDLELIATGCGVLGSGGGGQTHHEFLKALHTLRNGGRGKMRVISPTSLKDDDTIYFGSLYGSPSVINERMTGGTEIVRGIEVISTIDGRPIDALLPDEIGGGNGLSGFSAAVHFDIPVVDGDTMGRAYPTMHHATQSVYGFPLVPCALTDGRGNVNIVMSTDTPERLETLLRAMAIELGLSCAVCTAPLSGWAVKKYTVPNSMSQAWYLGRAIHLARRQKKSFVDAIFAISSGKLLFTGKIIDVRRHLGGGYTLGSVLIAPLTYDERKQMISTTTSSPNRMPPSGDRFMTIPFQNEFLYAALTDSEGSPESEQVVCTVPDLISVLGQDGEAIGSQDLRYGLYVDVISLPAHPLWKTEKGIKVGGPAGFGLSMPPVGFDDEEFTEPRSIIEEFGH